MSTMKIVILTVVVLVVILLVVVAIIGVMVYSIISSLSAEPEPLAPEVVSEGQAVERKVESAVSDQSAFYIELTDEDLSSLLRYRVGSVSAVRDINVEINPGVLDVHGSIGNTPPVSFSGSIDVTFEDGLIELDVEDISLTFLPVPGAVREELQPLIDEGLDINRTLSESGAVSIQRFDMEPGKVTIVGIQSSGASVSSVTTESFRQAFQTSGGGPAPVPPGANEVPPGTAGVSEPGDELYLALGDSLAANVGVNRPQEGYVSRFHAHLERETGRDLGLMNLGISGESTISIMRGQLPQALDEIRRRRDDGDPTTRVSVLTLDLGANNLLPHLGSAECQEAPRGNACQARIAAGLASFSEDFPEIVETLSSELEPDAEFYIMTMYNPFDFGLGIPFEDFSNETVERLNDIITQAANSAGARLADPYPLMDGHASAWTNMLEGDIHPNADGYQVLAYSLAQAR